MLRNATLSILISGMLGCAGSLYSEARIEIITDGKYFITATAKTSETAKSKWEKGANEVCANNKYTIETITGNVSIFKEGTSYAESTQIIAGVPITVPGGTTKGFFRAEANILCGQ